METRANYVIVGIFTLVAVFAAFAFVYWTARLSDRGETALLRVRIPGSASGLNTTSQVLFNGVRVGTVQRVYLDVNDPTIAIADTLVDRLTPITQSTRADISIAGLTGQANIELRGANLEEPKLLDVAEESGNVAEISANPSAVTNLLETAQNIFTRADRVLANLEGFVGDARQPLTRTINNVEKFSQALADNSDGVDGFLASVTRLSEQLAGASDKLEATLTAAEGLIQSVDRDDVRRIVGNVETLTANLAESSKRVDGVIASVNGAVTSITEFSEDARKALAQLDQVIAAVDPQAVRDTVGNLRTATREAGKVIEDVGKVTSTIADRQDDINRVITNVETASQGANQVIADVSKVTSRVGDRAGDIDRLIVDAGELADRLNQAAGRADEILASVNPKAVGTTISNIESASKTADKVMDDVSRVTSKIGERADDVDRFIVDARQFADRLNHASLRVDGILAKVDSLLGSGEANGLMTEASETLRSFKQVADTLNARLGGILDGISQFSGSGLRDVEAFVREGRRSLGRIQEAVSDFERNPQRILTGGDGTVRQYDGRVRR